jgi:hypothetical protein
MMSVKIMGIVWEADLPQREKFVLLAYADHADHDGNNIFPSVGLIAWKTGYDARTIQRITKKLIEDGYMIPQGQSQYSTNRYAIAVDRLPTLAPYGRGVRLSPSIYGGDILSPVKLSPGDKMGGEGVTKWQEGGDIAMSPKPSLTIIKPSEEGAATLVNISPIKILCEASGLSAFPGDMQQWNEVIYSLAQDHSIEATTAAMKKACAQWVATIGKNGRPYRKTNLAWINLAQELLAGGSIDAPAKDPKDMTDDEYKAWLLQGAEKT